MTRKMIIGTLTAAAIATAGISTPASAQPDGEDYFKALLGIAVLGAFISEAEKRKRARRNAEVQYKYEPEPKRHGKRIHSHRKGKGYAHRHGKGYKHRHGNLVHSHR